MAEFIPKFIQTHSLALCKIYFAACEDYVERQELTDGEKLAVSRHSGEWFNNAMKLFVKRKTKR